MNRTKRRNLGMSLVEVLIGCAITATLLTAVAAAFQASAAGVTHNDQFTRAAQASRVSVNQIMAQVRKCQSGVVDDTSLELTDDAGNVSTFNFDADAKKLTVTLDGITPVTRTMASNVESVQFLTDGRTISMTVRVQIGRNSVTLNGSAFPRRLMKYE